MKRSIHFFTAHYKPVVYVSNVGQFVCKTDKPFVYAFGSSTKEAYSNYIKRRYLCTLKESRNDKHI